MVKRSPEASTSYDEAMNDHLDFVIDAPDPGKEHQFPQKRFGLRDQQFRTARVISGWLMLEIGEAQDPSCPPWKQSVLSKQFLVEAVDPEDRDRFVELMREAQPPIGAEELSQLTFKLLAAIGDGAPLDTSSTSGSGQPGIDAGSGGSFS